MAYVNKFDRDGSCAIQGQKAEDTCKILLEREGATVVKATKAQEFDHIDLIATDQSGTTTYEVKARKRIKRGDDNYNDDLIYLEFINVAGKEGWIYGRANFIIFEGAEDFIIVDRLKLVEMAEKKCFVAKLMPYPTLYHGYRRRGRSDLVSLVKRSDVLGICHKILRKSS